MALVILNQTFRKGETAVLECNDDCGAPPIPINWLRNGSFVWYTYSGRIGFEDVYHTLIIEDINESDAGIYQCRLCNYFGCIYANITVNVIGPPLEETINPNLPYYLNATYGRPLRLDCRSPQAQPTVYFSWVDFYNEERVHSHLLDVASEDVLRETDTYRCLAYSAYGKVARHTVQVTMVDLPPVPVGTDRDITINATDQQEWVHTINFKFLYNSRMEWKALENGEIVDFGSRFIYRIETFWQERVNDTKLEKEVYWRYSLILRNSDTMLRDEGHYLLNVSNQYGYAEFRVHINVQELLRERREVQMQVKGISSNLDGML